MFRSWMIVVVLLFSGCASQRQPEFFAPAPTGDYMSYGVKDWADCKAGERQPALTYGEQLILELVRLAVALCDRS